MSLLTHFSVALLLGCMKKVEINGRVQDLNRVQKQNKVVPGCGGAQMHDEAAGTLVEGKMSSMFGGSLSSSSLAALASRKIEETESKIYLENRNGDQNPPVNGKSPDAEGF